MMKVRTVMLVTANSRGQYLSKTISTQLIPTSQKHLSQTIETDAMESWLGHRIQQVFLDDPRTHYSHLAKGGGKMSQGKSL